MKEFSYTLRCTQGIHGNPALSLVREASRYRSRITVAKGPHTANARMLRPLLELSAACGDTVHVQIEGDDEAATFDAINRYFTINL